MFTWQEKRKVTGSLTLHYKRVLYLLDDSDVARRAIGNYVDIRETEDGALFIFHEGRELPARPFNKEGHVHQAAIVDNKVLGAALQYAKELQQQRDDAKLKSSHMTKRDKRLLKASQLSAAAPPA